MCEKMGYDFRANFCLPFLNIFEHYSGKVGWLLKGCHFKDDLSIQKGLCRLASQGGGDSQPIEGESVVVGEKFLRIPRKFRSLAA